MMAESSHAVTVTGSLAPGKVNPVTVRVVKFTMMPRECGSGFAFSFDVSIAVPRHASVRTVSAA
jgi:hypothetical protein